MLDVMATSWNPEYAFGVGCRNDACRARIEWEVELTKLPVRPLSEESRAAFVGGNRFETTLPDAGERVRFRLLTGEDARKLPALQRSAPDKLLFAVLAYRVLDIDGVDGKAKRQFPEDLTLRDADILVDEFDRVDYGVDTTIEIECPDCFATQDVDLPFDKGFFLPGRDRTARRKAWSASSPTRPWRRGARASSSAAGSSTEAPASQ